jgi:hypothetical protein
MIASAQTSAAGIATAGYGLSADIVLTIADRSCRESSCGFAVTGADKLTLSAISN